MPPNSSKERGCGQIRGNIEVITVTITIYNKYHSDGRLSREKLAYALGGVPGEDSADVESKGKKAKDVMELL